MCEEKWGMKEEGSYGDSNLRGQSAKVNPSGGRVSGATGAFNRRTGKKQSSAACGLASEGIYCAYLSRVIRRIHTDCSKNRNERNNYI